MSKKLYHWCPECKQIVAKKKNERLDFPVECKHDPSVWHPMYMENVSISPDPADEDLINLVELRKLQKAGHVMRGRPADWRKFDIPKELKTDWTAYLDAKENLIATMAKYGIDIEGMK